MNSTMGSSYASNLQSTDLVADHVQPCSGSNKTNIEALWCNK
jgi:hypothetical protein